MLAQIILDRIRGISQSHIVHPGLEIFKDRPEQPKGPSAPSTPAAAALPPPPSVPSAQEDRKPWEASPTRAETADPPPEEDPEAIENRKAEEEKIKKEEEEREAREWVVQPEQVPGLKESGWTKEMDEMSVLPPSRLPLSFRLALLTA